ncbi:MAG: lytic transglycosylase domain-containing protein [Alphaproteobacteria bacterium]
MAAAARPLTKLARVGLCALTIALAFVGADALSAHAADRQEAGELQTAAVQPGAIGSRRATDLPAVLSEADRTLYRRLFAQEAKGNHAVTDLLLTKLSEPILIGDVLAARYLAATYRTNYAELSAWLVLYGDRPDAGAIYRLALSKKPKTAAAPKKPSSLSADVKRSPHGAALERVACAAGKGRTASLKSAQQELSRNDNGMALALIESLANAPDCPEAMWIAGLAAFRLGDDETARRHFETLAETAGAPESLIAAGAYWAGRVHLRAKRPQLVSHWLGAAAEHSRTFYGLIAQRALGMTVRPMWDREPMTAAALDAIGNLPRLRHAIALYQVGEGERAEPLVLSLIERATPEMQRALLPLVQSLGAPGLEVALAKRAASVDGRRHDASAYPMPDWRPANGRAFDRAFVFALIRSESGFQSRARNPSGASGIMQLMPATARFAAKRAGIKGVNAASINKPEISIALGQSYIDYLVETPEVEGNLFRLVAAYNAGPGAVGRWSEATEGDDPLLFIETLPSRETRDLIERVTADYWIYRMRLGEPTPSLDDVAANRWPRYEGKVARKIAKNG